LAKAQHLNKQAGQGIQVPAAEIADAAVVRLLVAGEHPEGGVFPAGLLDLSRCLQKNPVAEGVFLGLKLISG
jgi:hypothetical protein